MTHSEPSGAPRASQSVRWTRFVVRHRGAILAGWLVLFVLGAAGAANLGGLLSDRFSVPGSDSDAG